MWNPVNQLCRAHALPHDFSFIKYKLFYLGFFHKAEEEGGGGKMIIGKFGGASKGLQYCMEESLNIDLQTCIQIQHLLQSFLPTDLLIPRFIVWWPIILLEW